jgi:hypothetical protein
MRIRNFGRLRRRRANRPIGNADATAITNPRAKGAVAGRTEALSLAWSVMVDVVGVPAFNCGSCWLKVQVISEAPEQPREMASIRPAVAFSVVLIVVVAPGVRETDEALSVPLKSDT